MRVEKAGGIEFLVGPVELKPTRPKTRSESVENDLNIEDRPQIERIIAGAFKSAIDAHGNITPSLLGSAAKRVCGVLRQIAKDQKTKGQ